MKMRAPSSSAYCTCKSTIQLYDKNSKDRAEMTRTRTENKGRANGMQSDSPVSVCVGAPDNVTHAYAVTSLFPVPFRNSCRYPPSLYCPPAHLT